MSHPTRLPVGTWFGRTRQLRDHGCNLAPAPPRTARCDRCGAGAGTAIEREPRPRRRRPQPCVSTRVNGRHRAGSRTCRETRAPGAIRRGRRTAPATLPRKYSWKRYSPVISGWKLVPSRLPCSTATTRPSASAASGVAAGPTDSTTGPRMNTACTGSSPSAGIVEVGLERLVLRAEGVAAHDDVEAAEALLAGDRVEHGVGEHDEPGAGAVHRQPAGDRGLQRLGEAERARELVHDARLAAGDDEAVDLGELLGPTHRATRRAPSRVSTARARGSRPGGRARRRGVRPRPPPRVERLAAEVRRHQPRSARRCGAARSPTLMPTMASPSPRDTSAITDGSS